MARLQPCSLPASVSPGVKWADGGRLLLVSTPWLPSFPSSADMLPLTLPKGFFPSDFTLPPAPAISPSLLNWVPLALVAKESVCNAGDLNLIPGSGRSPGEGHGYPLQYSCLENSMDRGAWQATVHGVGKSWIRLNH